MREIPSSLVLLPGVGVVSANPHTNSYRHRRNKVAENNNIVVKLNEEEIVLKPSVTAMRMISRQYGGLNPARQMLVAENFDAVVFIIRVGAGMKDREARDLDDKVYETGLTGDLLVQLINYVAMLGNKGKPIVLGEENDEAPKSDNNY